MPSQTHPTSDPAVVQLSQLTGDAWARALGPRLPADLALQAHTHKALQRRTAQLSFDCYILPNPAKTRARVL